MHEYDKKKNSSYRDDGFLSQNPEHAHAQAHITQHFISHVNLSFLSPICCKPAHPLKTDQHFSCPWRHPQTSLLGCPIYLTYNISIVLTLHSSKPPQPNCLNNQAQWFQSQQFFTPCTFHSFPDANPHGRKSILRDTEMHLTEWWNRNINTRRQIIHHHVASINACSRTTQPHRFTNYYYIRPSWLTIYGNKIQIYLSTVGPYTLNIYTRCFRKKHPLILLAISWGIVVWF